VTLPAATTSTVITPSYSRRRRMIAGLSTVSNIFCNSRVMSRDRRQTRDLHALDDNGMLLCNPRDREAAHRAEMEGIATADRAAVTCRKCLPLLYKLEKARRESR
jgi:hypothetical protein